MRRTQIFVTAETLLVAVVLMLIFSAGVAVPVNAQTTVVSIKPAEVEVPEPGQIFTVDVNITDVTNLYGYEFKLFWKNDVLNLTTAVRPPGHFLEPVISPENIFAGKWEIKNDFNATHGRFWAVVTLTAPETAKNGSGVLARLNFTGINMGTTPLILSNGREGPVKLSDDKVKPIPHTGENGIVTVIPEFSINTVVPLLLIASLTAITAAKLTRSKKRLGANVTKGQL